MANNEVIKAAGIVPVVQTYGATWTSQIFVLADFANVTAQDPTWAQRYIANDAKYVDQPALTGFEHLQETFEAGYLNEDFASATLECGMSMLATGEAAHYPMLTALIATAQQNNPDTADDIGYFAMPADDAANTSATICQPQALFIAKSATGEKLDAAKRFVAFVNSPAGCEIQSASFPPGPYVHSGYTLPDSAPRVADDVQKYFDSDPCPLLASDSSRHRERRMGARARRLALRGLGARRL